MNRHRELTPLGRRNSWPAALAVVVVALSGIAIGASAAGASSTSDTINACVNLRSGALRVADTCTSKERSITIASSAAGASEQDLLDLSAAKAPRNVFRSGAERMLIDSPADETRADFDDEANVTDVGYMAAASVRTFVQTYEIAPGIGSEGDFYLNYPECPGAYPLQVFRSYTATLWVRDGESSTGFDVSDSRNPLWQEGSSEPQNVFYISGPELTFAPNAYPVHPLEIDMVIACAGNKAPSLPLPPVTGTSEITSVTCVNGSVTVTWQGFDPNSISIGRNNAGDGFVPTPEELEANVATSNEPAEFLTPGETQVDLYYPDYPFILDTATVVCS